MADARSCGRGQVIAMPRVYECVQWNPDTQTCDVAAWVERASMVEALPTVAQAQQVGAAMFLAVCGVAALSLLVPSRSYSDD